MMMTGASPILGNRNTWVCSTKFPKSADFSTFVIGTFLLRRVVAIQPLKRLRRDSTEFDGLGDVRCQDVGVS